MVVNSKRIRRVMKTLKNEEVYLWEYENFLDVVAGIGYLPPEEFEEMLRDKNKKKEMAQAVLISSGKKYS